jgi:hypothetical protein
VVFEWGEEEDEAEFLERVSECLLCLLLLLFLLEVSTR